MDVPHVKREDYQLTDIDDGFLVLMNDNGDLREDLKIPDGDLGVQLKSEYDGGKELLVSINFDKFDRNSGSLIEAFKKQNAIKTEIEDKKTRFTILADKKVATDKIMLCQRNSTYSKKHNTYEVIFLLD
jgi:hypothetical protein